MRRLLDCLLLLFFMTACTNYSPKPRGYYRISLPKSQYKPFNLKRCSFTFRVSSYANVEIPVEAKFGIDALNIVYPSFNATIYCSGFKVPAKEILKLNEDSRALIERESRQIKDVKEQYYSNPNDKVYGSLFFLDDEAASPIHFMLTDSVSNFFRGSLYFNCKMNADSLAPVKEYIQKDIVQLIQTFKWKNR